MEYEKIEKTLRYTRWRKSIRDYILIQLMLELDMNTEDILHLKVGDIRGKRSIVNKKNELCIISPSLAEEIYHFTEFVADDEYLFVTRNGKPLTRSAAWKVMSECFDEAGIEDVPFLLRLRGIYQKNMR